MFTRLRLALRARPGDHDSARLRWEGIPVTDNTAAQAIDATAILTGATHAGRNVALRPDARVELVFEINGAYFKV